MIEHPRKDAARVMSGDRDWKVETALRTDERFFSTQVAFSILQFLAGTVFSL